MHPNWKSAIGIVLFLIACVVGTYAQTSQRVIPPIHNMSDTSAEHVEMLVRKALDGLGFDGAQEGPNANDRVIVGQYYIAWIDETGFYGKMNGLWILNGASGDELDFVLKDNDRPVNSFIVGENDDGQFPSSYQGAEHMEFPNRTPELNDDPNCAKKDWCNQYSLAEAVIIKNARIRWWEACNVNRPSFSEKHAPVLVATLLDGGLKLVYEGRLTKEADGDGNYDGDACHEDYLFPDGVRRRVLLRMGYELHPREKYIDRTMQFVNPLGNPALDGDMSLIGGFVMTEYPAMHPLKKLTFWRAGLSDLQVGSVPLLKGVWTDLGQPARSEDVLVGWAGQPLQVSPVAGASPGRTYTVENTGPSDNADVGACLCSVHGAIELGGGLLHKASLGIAGGQKSLEARRRLSF